MTSYDIYMDKDDSFMRSYNQSKIGAKTIILVTLRESLTPSINENSLLTPAQNQNNYQIFYAIQSHPNPRQALVTPLKLYLCDTIVRVTFYEAHDLQVQILKVIGEFGGTMVRSG
ncbi:MAG: hypothetical protein EZS28_008834 [Streblomastix strix]|uniref:Uncharacterized protein n=1 Tax=Streblomastix strix TaxID=222440 RepID=A0A5J4WKR4_9EUKA|nr:MAG: hypothetical protein EZS28_008834 [Streblomastix strix]